MENVTRQLKKAKTWNMVLLVLTGISAVTSLIGLPGTLNPKKETYDVLGSTGKKFYEHINSIGVKAYSVIALLVIIALVVLFFLANKKLKEQQLAPKYPYYIYIGYTVVSILYSLLLTPKLELPDVGSEAVAAVTTVTTIVMLIIQVLFMIPAIIVLVHLFKADTQE